MTIKPDFSGWVDTAQTRPNASLFFPEEWFSARASICSDAHQAVYTRTTDPVVGGPRQASRDSGTAVVAEDDGGGTVWMGA